MYRLENSPTNAFYPDVLELVNHELEALLMKGQQAAADSAADAAQPTAASTWGADSWAKVKDEIATFWRRWAKVSASDSTLPASSSPDPAVPAAAASPPKDLVDLVKSLNVTAPAKTVKASAVADDSSSSETDDDDVPNAKPDQDTIMKALFASAGSALFADRLSPLCDRPLRTLLSMPIGEIGDQGLTRTPEPSMLAWMQKPADTAAKRVDDSDDDASVSDASVAAGDDKGADAQPAKAPPHPARGLFYALGTLFGTQNWVNPCERGLVAVQHAPWPCENATSEPVNSFCGRRGIKLALRGDPSFPIYYQIDLGAFTALPSHYTIRSRAARMPDGWSLQASCDGVYWSLLHSHFGALTSSSLSEFRELTLSLPAGVASAALNDQPNRGTAKGFRLFRVYSTSSTESAARQVRPLHISGLELFGSLFWPNAVEVLKDICMPALTRTAGSATVATSGHARHFHPAQGQKSHSGFVHPPHEFKARLIAFLAPRALQLYQCYGTSDVSSSSLSSCSLFARPGLSLPLVHEAVLRALIDVRWMPAIEWLSAQSFDLNGAISAPPSVVASPAAAVADVNPAPPNAGQVWQPAVGDTPLALAIRRGAFLRSTYVAPVVGELIKRARMKLEPDVIMNMVCIAELIQLALIN